MSRKDRKLGADSHEGQRQFDRGVSPSRDEHTQRGDGVDYPSENVQKLIDQSNAEGSRRGAGSFTHEGEPAVVDANHVEIERKKIAARLKRESVDLSDHSRPRTQHQAEVKLPDRDKNDQKFVPARKGAANTQGKKS